MTSRWLTAAIGAGAILANSTAFADPAAAAGASGTSGLEEIVVTAQRKQEAVQTVPIAISVLTGASLADKNVNTVLDLQNALPSIQVEPAFGSSQPQFRIRGVGFLDYTSNNASPIGVSVDDVALALPIQTQGQLFDIDRVEVLRGPQGTLYGRNTTGGQINFISNRPTEDTHAGASVEYGSHNETDFQGFASGTLVDTLTGRVAVASEQGGAWQHERETGQSLGKKNRVSGRGQLEWKPEDGVDLRLEVHGSQDKSEETGLQLIAPYTRYGANGGVVTTIPADTSRYVTAWNLSPALASLTGLSPGAKPGLDNSNLGANITGNFDFGWSKLTTISAYEKMIRREYSDWDATDYHDSDEYFHSGLHVFSQEARLASTGTGPFGWLAGVFYSDQYLDETFLSDFSDSQVIGAPGSVAGTTYGQKAIGIGEFAQVSYQFNSTLKATLGAREDHETRELIDLNTGFVIPVVPFTTDQSRSLTNNLPSGKFEIDYTPVEGTMFYESVSRGVKSGGFTAHNTTNAGQVDPFSPEKLLAYEIGVKSDLTHTVRVNASVFYYRYHDQQILGKVFDDLSHSYIGRFVNANSRLAGGEIETQWQPLPGLNISQYSGYVVGYYTSPLLDSTLPVANDYDNHALSVPKWTYGGDVSYAFDVGAFKVTADTNYSFHDTYSQYYLLGSDLFTIPKYWLANANLSVSPVAGGPWTFGIWGRNIFNRSYDVTRNFFLPGADVAQAGEPATFGIRASYKF